MNRVFLGLPLRRPRETLLSAGLLFVYYLFTMSRGLSMYDSPELAMVAGQLGLGHPIGQPVHTIVGAAFAAIGRLLPGVGEIVALNALSAAAGALCVLPAVSLAETLWPDENGEAPALLAPLLALLGVHAALWEPATRIEVYSLACLLALWGLAVFAAGLRDTDSQPRNFLVAGLCVGLAAATHPHFGFGAALALAPRTVIGLVRRDVRPRSVAAAVAGGITGLLPYLYVPLIARRQDVVVWGAPTNAKALARYFTGADFAHNRDITAEAWGGHIAEWARWVWSDPFFLALLLVGCGGYLWFSARRVLGRISYWILLGYFVALVTSNPRFAPDVLDYLEYLAIPLWLSAIGVALLTADLVRRRKILATVLVGAVVLLAVGASPQVHTRTRHRDHVTDHIATRALERAPDNAILLVDHDHWVAPLWYVQEREELRPDVAVVAFGLTGSSWYWEYLFRKHPHLQRIPLEAGGKAARIREFLRANQRLPLQVENIVLAGQVGVPACPSDWLLDVRSKCPDGAPISAIGWYVHDALRELEEGSPGTSGLLAMMAYDRGHDLWSLGFPRAALKTALAGVPGDPLLQDALERIPERAAVKERPRPDAGRVALGHPAANLRLASAIAQEFDAQSLVDHFNALAVRSW